MKKILKWFENSEIIPMAVGGSLIVVFCWFVYKIAIGIFHLLDKLIDKI